MLRYFYAIFKIGAHWQQTCFCSKAGAVNNQTFLKGIKKAAIAGGHFYF